MSYVPTPTSVPASPQAQELAHKLEHVIREYRQSHPGLSSSEVQQAIKMAETRTGAGGLRTQATVMAMVGLTVLLLLGSLFFWRMA